ncbi:MAG TPA: D-Ala-D-Ala carboxypeptidase family metallohydrolase [Agromyces sp.]
MPKLRPKYGVLGTVGPAPGFSWAEVRCTDGTLPTSLLMRRRFVVQARLLNVFRAKLAKRYGVPTSDVSIVVNSWYRSPAYNRRIGGASKSQHVEGRATDIRVYLKPRRAARVMLKPSFVAHLLARYVPQFAGGGIGWYDPAHGNFTHVDHRGYRARWVNVG